jgi:hypothetical protein
MNYKIILPIIFITIAAFNKNLISQETTKSKVTLGIQLISNYNFELKQENNLRIIQCTPSFSINFKNHKFYLGPQYTYIFQPTPIDNKIYESNSFGLNLGYRYYSNYLFKNARLFGDFNYSIFHVIYTEYQKGPPFETKKEEIFMENTVSLGFDYSIFKKFHLFMGIGFGSYSAFFLILKNFTLTSYVGLGYLF